MGEFEERVERLRATIGDDEADALLDGSTLRTRAKTAEDETKAERTRREKAEAALLKAHFESKGVKANPAKFRYDDDFDPTDPAKVDAFLLDAGLIEPPKDDIPAEEQAAHEAISAAATTGSVAPQGALTAEVVSEWPADRIMGFQQKYPQEYEAMMVSPETWKGVGLDI